MNPLATELNNTIRDSSPSVYDMMSKLGQKLFMPKGIISQGAEAQGKATKFNATIGIATEAGDSMHLKCIYRYFNGLTTSELFPYAPTAGLPELRQHWYDKLISENPSLSDKTIGRPIVTSALTHGLSIVADMFCEDGDYVVLPDKFWGNYRLIFNTRRGGVITTFPLFNEFDGFNVENLLKKVEDCSKLRRKVIVILNFPNNPTGYTPTIQEAREIVDGLKAIADMGTQLVVIADDAYFGMFYSETSIKESIFSMLAGISPNLLAIKLDGATKESFVWGFRVGFITFALPTEHTNKDLLSALEQKVMGCIRGNISSSPRPSQSIVLKALKDSSFISERAEKNNILRSRALKVKEILEDPKYTKYFKPYPFNSGYFLTLQLLKTNAEKLRVHLLDRHATGTIASNDTDLRVAFSCIEVDDLSELFEIIYKGCLELENE